MKRTVVGNERGAVSLGAWVLLLVIGVVIYLGVKLGPPWIDHYMLNDKIGNFVKMTSAPPNEEIISEIRQFVEDRNIPLDVDKDLQINREDGRFSIRAEWTVTVEFPGGNSRDISYVIEAEK
ncbi:MAG: hypothetical protein OEV28_10650 [Nitrospirota bacterium]|nr:hypothetical protein [Nitrospirota bacterium]